MFNNSRFQQLFKPKKLKSLIIIDSDSSQSGIQPRKIIKSNQESKYRKNPYKDILEVPAIQLSIQQMNNDPLKLLIKLEKQYSEYGAIKLITNQNWNPPFCFGFVDQNITTRIQHLHKFKHGKSFQEKQQAYNPRSFKILAQDFENHYKYRTNPVGQTKELKNQMEFWNLISSDKSKQDNKFKVTVQYAADLPVTKYGSGFPMSESKKTVDTNFKYHSNLFNLNNIYESPLSLLKIAKEKKEFISGVTSPWVYMGMLFSTFCWHVQDLWINSLNYSHKGAVKTWYVIPASDKEKFEEYVRKKTEKDGLLERITFMMDPIQVQKAGIKVYKINQHPKEYVFTFVKAYHCGFSNGFNIGQAVNIASVPNISLIKQAINYFKKSKSGKQLVFPYEWLIHSNLNSKFPLYDSDLAHSHQKQIAQEYNQIIKQQYNQIKQICQKIPITQMKQFRQQINYNKLICSNCSQFTYLHSVKCQKCQKVYCYKHAKSCCLASILLVREMIGQRKKIKSLYTNYRM